MNATRIYFLRTQASKQEIPCPDYGLTLKNSNTDCFCPKAQSTELQWIIADVSS